jgi:hypothetical protein
MATTDIAHDFPYAGPQIEHVRRRLVALIAIRETPDGRTLIDDAIEAKKAAVVVNQTPEQARAEWNGTASDAIDRRLLEKELRANGMGRALWGIDAYVDAAETFARDYEPDPRD